MFVVGFVIAIAAAFVVSAVLYGVGPSSPSSAPQRLAAGQAAVELLRNAAVVGLVGGLLGAADWSGASRGALLGLALFVLPLVLLAGSVFHEGVPASRAALHAADWLVKLIVVGAIVGLFI